MNKPIYINADLHAKLKAQAAAKRVSLAQWVESLLTPARKRKAS